MQRYRFYGFLLFIFLYGLTSCAGGSSLPPKITLPTAVATAGPPIPFQDPNIHAEVEARSRPVKNTQDLLQCLAAGQKVYGLTLQNTNVRSAPQANACRVGRIPRGSLVQISGSTGISNSAKVSSTLIITPTAVAPSAAASDNAEHIGYVEDIQPIFLRSCNTCHSAVVKNKGLQVTDYTTLMQGSLTGPVIIPGNADASLLWQKVRTGQMPLVGKLSDLEKAVIRDWIDLGAPETRATKPQPQTRTVTTGKPALWLQVDEQNINPVSDLCPTKVDPTQKLVSSELVLPISCGIAPRQPELLALYKQYSIPLPTPPPPPAANVAQTKALTTTPTASNSDKAPAAPAAAPATSGGAYAVGASSAQAGIQAAALNLAPPSGSDPWLTPRGGFCIEQQLPKHDLGVTALAFAPNGSLYMAEDAPLGEKTDQIQLYDAFHPSRSIAVYTPGNDSSYTQLLKESTRITGLTYSNGALYISRAGEVGRIVDGGKYEKLASGFAVNSQLFHANDGIAIVNNWLYMSDGGVHDGYSDGPVVGISEQAAQAYVSGGNPTAARLMRAPLDALLGQRSINVFQTAARGLRNPYGLTADPAGRLWFTDNGATNVPDSVSAGDEVNLFNPSAVAPGTPDDATPYYGFPLALNGNPPDWYTKPIVALPNSAAPTGITWAYGTIFYAQYGGNPGLYRLGRAGDGQIISERILQFWPLLAVTTAPDGAIWIGTGTGALYRLTPGC